MKNKPSANPLIQSVTAEDVFLNRRKILANMGYLLSGSVASLALVAKESKNICQSNTEEIAEILKKSNLKPNSWNEITRYNNYYEFSTNKEAIHILAQSLTTKPWTISIEGEVRKEKHFDIDKLLTMFPVEQRIYPLRCVEGWSMVIPWQGFSLCQLLKMVEPTSKARYVEFVSLFRPEEMIGQRRETLVWPFTEALTIEEALHPLTFIATGLYGKPLPHQNGAPLRLVVPWKYGFKSIKAITKIRLLKEKPVTSWNTTAPSEYGFYANVNPDVSHPRWSQKRENRIGELRKRATLPFNGYADQVAHLYKNLDLSENF